MLHRHHHHHGVSADVSLPVPPHCFFVSSHGRPPTSASVVLRVDSMDDDEDVASPSPPSARDILARESAELHDLQRRFSVRDLASKFENGQAAAEAAVEKLSADMRLSQAAYLDQQSLLQNLREVLEALRGRVAGSNKDDAEEALTTVDALSLQLSQRDAELAQEKSEVRKLAELFKQASDDTKKMVEEAKSIAQAEIEAARAATQRMEEALEEREKFYGFLSQQELEDMRKEVQEARRIKMLHESSKVMDMEHELEGLRQQLVQKTVEVMNLRKELEAIRSSNEGRSQFFQLEGVETLGSCLQVTVLDHCNIDLSQCSFQWRRVSEEGNKIELISGAVKHQYAPEPFDLGRTLQVEISMLNGEKTVVSSSGVIDPAPGLGNYVEALVRKGGAEFQVIILHQNGEVVAKQSVHGFHIGRVRIKLRKGRSTKAKEPYSLSMQLCGARGGGMSAAQGLFWQAKEGLTFLLAFESARERNAAIMLARRFSFDCNIMLAGPDDRAALGK